MKLAQRNHPFSTTRTIKMAMPRVAFAVCAFVLAVSSANAEFELRKDDHISIIGNNLADRMQHDGWLETLIQNRFPKHELQFRNLGFPGDEINKRPRSNNFGTPDQWLTKVKTDVVFAFFGYAESFAGEGGVDSFTRDLANFIDHTRKQNYSGRSNARLVLFSPIAHENLNNRLLPDGKENNARLALYTKAMQSVAKDKGVPFVDLFSASQILYLSAKEPLTMNGVHLNTSGNRAIAHIIDASLFDKGQFGNAQFGNVQFGNATFTYHKTPEKLRQAVIDKNFHWFNLYRTVDGYNVYGGRSKLSWHGQSNADVMAVEMEVFNVKTQNRDKKIWAIAQGRDHVVKDDNLPKLLDVKTNRPGPLDGKYRFLGGEEAIEKMTIAKGMQVNLFASEEQFPELINPVQMAVDPDGRLFVAVWPTYPHWNPTKPLNDKIIMLTDEDGDGKADKSTTFADGLNSVTGFEFWGGGMLVAAAPEILFLKDTDGDGKADVKKRMLQGVSSADTHHTANALVIGPHGGLYWSRGVFHVTNMETPTQIFRSTRSGVYRFDPRTFEIGFHFPIAPNPHGDVFDQWGNQFANDGTGGTGNHVAIGGGVGAPQQWFRKRVRPVPATGILSSEHFPEGHRGNFLICNAIGFLGVLQHEVKFDGATITAQEIEPILYSSDPNFRPTDVEMGGDGALYVSDWCNPLIGHMQHNMRDPNRDDLHGRVYRVTYKGRPADKPVKLIGKPLKDVFAAFYNKGNTVRYRARLELSGRKTEDVINGLQSWTASIQPNNAANEQALLEALWVHSEHRVPNAALLNKVFQAKEPRVRAAALRTLRHWGPLVKDWAPLLLAAARDESALVRADAVLAATSFEGLDAAEAIFEVATRPTDVQLDFNLNFAKGRINVDRLVQNAIASEKPMSKAAQAYALQKASVGSLLKMKRTEAVADALLYRSSVNAVDRISALKTLALHHKTSAVQELLKAIANPDGRYDASIGDLNDLLSLLPAKDLKDDAALIAALAKATRQPATRQAAYTALMIADGSAQRVKQLASESIDNMRSFMIALQSIKDSATLDSVYSTVKALTNTLPANLKAETEGKPGAVGRFVRVELPRNGTLTLAEVEILSAGSHIGKGRPAKQSTTASGGTADRAVDGNTNTVYGAGSSTHTHENSKNPWWEVDLGSDQPIEEIKVWNRTDCCSDRLDGFNITVLDSSRSPVWSALNNKLKASPTVGFELAGDPAAAIHVAAINTLVRIPGHDKESFEQLSSLIASNRYRGPAVSAILQTKQNTWAQERASQLATALNEFVPTIPLNKRTSKIFKDSQTLAKRISPLLPKAEADKLASAMSNLDLQVIRIATIPERMLYDKSTFAVVAGKPVRVVLTNKDHMPHNLFIVKPGAADKVGILAEKMGANGFEKAFHPDTPLILFGDKSVQPGESVALDFIAPTQPGDYEYVCTFPGHYRLMRGVMKVVATADQLPANAAGDRPTVVHDWKLKDLEPDLQHIAHGRSYKNGLAVYTKLGCMQCHKMGNEGGAVGPALTEVLKKWKNNRRDVLEQLLDPSKVIDDNYKAYDVETDDGRFFGLIASQGKDHIMMITNPQNPVPQKIMKKDIVEQRATKSSLMPTGLLNLLERSDILDLMAYLEAGGNPKHMLYMKH